MFTAHALATHTGQDWAKHRAGATPDDVCGRTLLSSLLCSSLPPTVKTKVRVAGANTRVQAAGANMKVGGANTRVAGANMKVGADPTTSPTTSSSTTPTDLGGALMGLEYMLGGAFVGVLAGPMIGFMWASPHVLLPTLVLGGGYAAGNWLLQGDGSPTDNAIAFGVGAATLGGANALGVGLARMLFHFGPLGFWPSLGWTLGLLAAGVAWEAVKPAGL